MFHVVMPLPFVDLSVWPGILTLTLHFILHILSLINAAVPEYLAALSLPLVHPPLTIITLPIVIQHDPLAFSPTLSKLSIVHSLFVFF
jgi:hypothetical protein